MKSKSAKNTSLDRLAIDFSRPTFSIFLLPSIGTPHRRSNLSFDFVKSFMSFVKYIIHVLDYSHQIVDHLVHFNNAESPFLIACWTPPLPLQVHLWRMRRTYYISFLIHFGSDLFTFDCLYLSHSGITMNTLFFDNEVVNTVVSVIVRSFLLFTNIGVTGVHDLVFLGNFLVGILRSSLHFIDVN